MNVVVARAFGHMQYWTLQGHLMVLGLRVPKASTWDYLAPLILAFFPAVSYLKIAVIIPLHLKHLL